MAISIYQTDSGRVPGFEYMPCDAITPKLGMAMKLDGGKLKKASGTDKPKYISMTEREAACASGELIPVVRVGEDIVFSAPTPSGFTALPGATVQISSDGCGLSASAGGAAEVVRSGEDATLFRICTPAAQTSGGNTASQG